MPIRAYNTRVLTDEFDFSGNSNSIEVGLEVPNIDYNVFQTSHVLRIPNNPSATIAHNGYYNGPDAGDWEKELYDRLGTTTAAYATAIFGTSETIPVAYTIDSTWSDQLAVAAQTDQLITVNGNWASGSEQTYRCYQLYYGTISATGTQTGIDFGSAGSAGGVAYVHIISITGSASSATIDIESDDNSGFTSAASEGTATFSAVGVQKVTMTGTVDRYLRINTTSLGGATDFTVAVVAAVSGVTY